MFGLQPMHLILILIIALVIFGPKRLPELGRSLGESINEFRNATKEEPPATPKPGAEAKEDTAQADDQQVNP